MAARREESLRPSVVVGWCDESDSFGEEMGHERLRVWPAGRISEQDGAHRYWWELPEFWKKPWLLAEPLVDLNTGSFSGPKVQDEVIKELGNRPQQWAERILRSKHISGKNRSSVLEDALGLAQLGLGTLAGWLATQDWEVMQSSKKAEAVTALADSTMHDDDDGSAELRAAVLARDEASEAMTPVGSVPRPLGTDARPAQGRDVLELAANWIPRGASPRLSLRT